MTSTLPSGSILPPSYGCPIVNRIGQDVTMDISDRILGRTHWIEISGSAASSKLDNILFAHNDSPETNTDRGYFAAWDYATGKRMRTFRLPETVLGQDWEAMAIGSCAFPDEEDAECVYIADVGDNQAQSSVGQESQRPSGRPTTIYKIRHPEWNPRFPEGGFINIPDENVTALVIDYGHETSPTPFANCEAMFLDHVGWGGGDEAVGDLYLVPKWGLFNNRRFLRLFKIPASAWPTAPGQTGTFQPFAVGDYLAGEDELNSGEFFSYTWTSADMSRDGSKIALNDEDHVRVFARCPGQSVPEALLNEAEACVDWINPPEAANPGNQFESVTWLPDGSGLISIPESLNPPNMVQTELSYTPGPVEQCPEVRFTAAGDCATVEGGDLRPDAWCAAYAAITGGEPSEMPSLPPSVGPSTAPSVSPTDGPNPEPTAAPQAEAPPTAAPIAEAPTSGGATFGGGATVMAVASVLILLL